MGVVAPNDTAEYGQRKVDDWLEWRARLVWAIYRGLARVVVDAPGQQLRCFDADAALDGGDVLPGCACRVAEILPDFTDANQGATAC